MMRKYDRREAVESKGWEPAYNIGKELAQEEKYEACNRICVNMGGCGDSLVPDSAESFYGDIVRGPVRAGRLPVVLL